MQEKRSSQSGSLHSTDTIVDRIPIQYIVVANVGLHQAL